MKVHPKKNSSQSTYLPLKKLGAFALTTWGLFGGVAQGRRLSQDMGRSPALTPLAALPEPVFPANDLNNTYQPMDNGSRLFSHWGDHSNPEAAPGDVHQGHLSDCYLEATMAAYAEAFPEELPSHFTMLPEWNVNVTLFNNQGVPHYQVVGETFPRSPTGRYMGERVNEGNDTFWPAVLEKAVAQDNTNNPQRLIDAGNNDAGYNTLNTGGTAAEAAQVMFNVKMNEIWPISMAPADVMALGNTTNAVQKSMVIFEIPGTLDLYVQNNPAAVLDGDTLRYPNGHTLQIQGANAVLQDANGIILSTPSDHNYPLLGVDWARNQLKLYNPWGFMSGESRESLALTDNNDISGVFRLRPEHVGEIFYHGYAKA